MIQFKSERGGSLAWMVISIVLVALVVLYFMLTNTSSEVAPIEEVAVEGQSTATMMRNNDPIQDLGAMEVDEARGAVMAELVYSHQAQLVDVTDGNVVRGIATGNQATGRAVAGLSDEFYVLMASFEYLPQPQGTDFYEGWVVRRDPLSVVSTGKLTSTDGVYTNTYLSTTDFTDHDLYVLTVEPSDGDPAPADHVVEGMFVAVDGGVMFMNKQSEMSEEGHMMENNESQEESIVSDEVSEGTEVDIVTDETPE